MTNTIKSTDISLKIPTIMTFSATDPSSGAGLQADLLTLASLHTHPASIITGFTVQDTAGVEDVQAIDAEFINQQARLLLEDMPIAAFKAGVLCSIENMAVVAEIVNDYPDIPFILDPIFASGRGDRFLDNKAHEALCDLLLPSCTLITPNSIEAQKLCAIDEDAGSIEHDTCAEMLLNYGCEFVMITGGHDPTPNIINRLYSSEGLELQLECPRLNGNYHGSGCTLTSAIAAYIAHGLPIIEAVKKAHEYTWQTLAHAYSPGMGQAIPQRLFQLYPNQKI